MFIQDWNDVTFPLVIFWDRSWPLNYPFTHFIIKTTTNNSLNGSGTKRIMFFLIYLSQDLQILVTKAIYIKDSAFDGFSFHEKSRNLTISRGKRKQYSFTIVRKSETFIFLLFAKFELGMSLLPLPISRQSTAIISKTICRVTNREAYILLSLRVVH